MKKKQLLIALLLCTNICIQPMLSSEGSASTTAKEQRCLSQSLPVTDLPGDELYDDMSELSQIPSREGSPRAHPEPTEDPNNPYLGLTVQQAAAKSRSRRATFSPETDPGTPAVDNSAFSEDDDGESVKADANGWVKNNGKLMNRRKVMNLLRQSRRDRAQTIAETSDEQPAVSTAIGQDQLTPASAASEDTPVPTIFSTPKHPSANLELPTPPTSGDSSKRPNRGPQKTAPTAPPIPQAPARPKPEQSAPAHQEPKPTAVTAADPLGDATEKAIASTQTALDARKKAQVAARGDAGQPKSEQTGDNRQDGTKRRHPKHQPKGDKRTKRHGSQPLPGEAPVANLPKQGRLVKVDLTQPPLSVPQEIDPKLIVNSDDQQLLHAKEASRGNNGRQARAAAQLSTSNSQRPSSHARSFTPSKVCRSFANISFEAGSTMAATDVIEAIMNAIDAKTNILSNKINRWVSKETLAAMLGGGTSSATLTLLNNAKIVEEHTISVQDGNTRFDIDQDNLNKLQSSTCLAFFTGSLKGWSGQTLSKLAQKTLEDRGYRIIEGSAGHQNLKFFAHLVINLACATVQNVWDGRRSGDALHHTITTAGSSPRNLKNLPPQEHYSEATELKRSQPPTPKGSTHTSPRVNSVPSGGIDS